MGYLIGFAIGLAVGIVLTALYGRRELNRLHQLFVAAHGSVLRVEQIASATLRHVRKGAVDAGELAENKIRSIGQAAKNVAQDVAGEAKKL